jgi:DNA-binding NtrC family response regulator/tetratricopeptide (TPR) repeat protein
MAATTLNPHPLARGFVELDDRVLSSASGAILVFAPSADIAGAAAAHIARRSAVKGVPVLEARPRGGAPIFREVQAQLGLSGSCDVERCAAEIAGVAGTVILPLPREGTWDRAVLQELARSRVSRASPGAEVPQSTQLLVLLSWDKDPAADLDLESFDVSEKMTSEGRRRWFSAVAERACVDVGVGDLATLDSSFANVNRKLTEASAVERTLPPGGEALLAALELVGRAWPVRDLAALGSDSAAFAHLSEAGAVRVVRGFVSIEPSWLATSEALATAAPRDAVLAAGALLHARFPEDPWAEAHRAELLLGAGEHSSADDAFTLALSLASDPLARRELLGRWSIALRAVANEDKIGLFVRSAERALAAGRAEEAYHWAELGAGVAPEDPYVALLLGRANVATGDLVAATVAFERGAKRASEETMTLSFLVEQAEVSYLRGALDEATALANEVLAAAKTPTLILEAKNTLGKILLARSRWDDADRHFEEDAWLASSSGLVTAELRARSNRAIALLSRGLVDKARALFETVLAEGERHGEVRACAFALDNLAVVASHQHQYVAALELWERAFKLRQQLGDRTALTHILGNLALIRLKLGLWEHAEHAIAFGRRMLGPGTPVARSAYFALCAARVALIRGRSMQARREAQGAIPESRASGNAKYLAEALRLMARIELEEGDLGRAREALAAARESLTTEEGRAETRILEASLARASGDIDPKDACEALALARLTDNEELLIEAQILCVEVYRAAGSYDVARRHLDQALALRDHVLSQLPDDIRPAYLSRPDCTALDRLDALLSGPVPAQPWVDAPDGGGPRWEGPESQPQTQRMISRLEPARTLIGEDAQIRALLVAVGKVAATSCTVLIRGESGTGKELVAQAVHAASDRAMGPLVTVNCAALVETLLLSELFGHEKGAFTGAASRRRGRFELAEGGTLFLDEIGDISPRTQVALLRVLQERTFERVGGAAPIHVNVRILCATHRDLKAMVDRGEFRQDLYYRLRGVTLDVPPLRMRMTDLALISEHLLARVSTERGDGTKKLSPDALELLARHKWPGNVRELENALRAASLFAEGSVITAEDLVKNVDDLRLLRDGRPDEAKNDPFGSGASPDSVRERGQATTVAYAQVRGGGASLSDIKRQIERDCIARALAETKGNITRAAALLGMKRPRLSQLVKHYGLSAPSSSEAS